MISRRDYLKDPCGTLSIPYWKWKQMVLPDGMIILHDRDIARSKHDGYWDDPYFRLRHDLEEICATEPEAYTVRTVKNQDISNITQIINGSYTDIHVTVDQVCAWKNLSVYDPDLWLLAVEKSTGRPVGCGIADFDKNAKEGILEWIQVLPEYRGKGIGKMLVCQLLRRMQGKADFATVSGSCLNESDPEKLYRSCGFFGNDVWHIMRKI